MNESVKIETFIFNVRYILQYFNSNEDYAQERDKYLIFKSEKKKICTYYASKLCPLQ